MRRPQTISRSAKIFSHSSEVFSRNFGSKIFADLDIVCGRLNHFRDVLTDEQAWANDYLQEYECTNGAKRVLPSSPVRLGSQGAFPLGKPIMYGASNQEILTGLGYNEEEIAAMTEAGVFR